LSSKYSAQIICAGSLEARPIFFLKFKGTPSQEEHKTIFSGLKICKMALSNQIDFPGFCPSPEDDSPEFHQFRNMTIHYGLSLLRRPYAVMFGNLTFPN
jgi:hypothetical protein